MKTEDEIARAHDILVAAIKIAEKSEDIAPVMGAAADVLCWVLDHAHNKAFADNLALIEGKMKAAGYELRRIEKKARASQRGPR